MCPVCHSLEPPNQPGTDSNRVILSDSTLFGVWDHPEIAKVSSHFEIECIVDGRIRDLTRALQYNLLCYSHRLEIVVIAGISNVADGQNADAVINELKEMKELVAEHNAKYREKNEAQSFLSICTLSLPPKFCTFRVPDTPELAMWKPSRSFKDRYPVIKKVNEEIKKINMADGINFFNLHMHGMKFLKSGPQHKFDTRPGAARIWRETNVFQKLHFTIENKIKVVKYLQKTFQSNART